MDVSCNLLRQQVRNNELHLRDKDSERGDQFKYLRVIFTSNGRKDQEIDRRIGDADAAIWMLYRSIVVNKELSVKAKLYIYQSMYIPTLTHCQDTLERLYLGWPGKALVFSNDHLIFTALNHNSSPSNVLHIVRPTMIQRQHQQPNNPF